MPGGQINIPDLVIVIQLEEERTIWEIYRVNKNVTIFPLGSVSLSNLMCAHYPIIEEENMYMNQEAITDDNTSKASDVDEEDNKKPPAGLQAKMAGGGMGFGNIINKDILSAARLKKVSGKEDKKANKDEKLQPPLPDKASALKPAVSGLLLTPFTPKINKLYSPNLLRRNVEVM